MLPESNNRMIVVSNRLPFVLGRDERGQWEMQPGAGGLITALEPVLRKRGGVWIGWTGTTDTVPELDRLAAEATREAGYELRPVALSMEERDKFYYGFANETVWPLFHDLLTLCNFAPPYWHAYRAVNDKFAQAVIDIRQPGDFVWVHDYQLMTVAQSLRERGHGGNLAFFLHIPFPPLDLFLKMPHRLRLLRALLAYDLLGFQTQRDQRNFIHCVRHLITEARITCKNNLNIIRVCACPTNRICEREARVGAFPIGIDFDEFAGHAASEEVAQKAWFLHEDLSRQTIVLGVDRLDYTKGIPHRLEAFRNALARYPDLRGKVTLIQIAVPSRAEIPLYADLKTRIERLVGEINGQFTSSGWVPVHYLYRSVGREELLGYYRMAEVALITPLKDGMNLVCKEYCAANIEESGVLILSEFAGAAAQLHCGALLVNPYDVEETADAIHRAIMMPPEERRDRMRQLRRVVRTQDINLWVDSFIQAAIEKKMTAFPMTDEYFLVREEEEEGYREVG